MKVWLIIRYDYEDYEVLGIAINKKIAKEIRDADKDKYPNDFDIGQSYRWRITKYRVKMGGE